MIPNEHATPEQREFLVKLIAYLQDAADRGCGLVEFETEKVVEVSVNAGRRSVDVGREDVVIRLRGPQGRVLN